MPSEADIERARRAIMEAPLSESGLLIPPHVAEERAREAQETAGAAPPPNRAQRRWQAKQDRRQARREARLNLKQLAAMRDLEEASKKLTETQLIAAEAIVKDMAKMGRDDARAMIEELERGDAP